MNESSKEALEAAQKLFVKIYGSAPPMTKVVKAAVILEAFAAQRVAAAVQAKEAEWQQALKQSFADMNATPMQVAEESWRILNERVIAKAVQAEREAILAIVTSDSSEGDIGFIEYCIRLRGK